VKNLSQDRSPSGRYLKPKLMNMKQEYCLLESDVLYHQNFMVCIMYGIRVCICMCMCICICMYVCVDQCHCSYMFYISGNNLWILVLADSTV
jgi:hypothetical protein